MPQGQDWHNGPATQARIAAREVVSLESGGAFGYDCGVKSDNWEAPGYGYPHGGISHSARLRSVDHGQDKELGGCRVRSIRMSDNMPSTTLKGTVGDS